MSGNMLPSPSATDPTATQNVADGHAVEVRAALLGVLPFGRVVGAGASIGVHDGVDPALAGAKETNRTSRQSSTPITRAADLPRRIIGANPFVVVRAVHR
jgi:hypothetical protein